MTASFHPLEHKFSPVSGTKFSFLLDDGQTRPETIEIVYDITTNSGTFIEIHIVKYAISNKLPIEQVIMILRMAKSQELEFCEHLIDWTISNRNVESIEIVELLLKEGFQFSRVTLGTAFENQLPIQFVDRLYELGARPLQHTYLYLGHSWNFKKSDSDAKLKNITLYLKRLKNWGQPFPETLLPQLAKICDDLRDGFELLKLIDVCIDEGVSISPEQIPDFVAVLVQYYRNKKLDLESIERILQKLRAKLPALDERFTFLHAIVYGNKLSDDDIPLIGRVLAKEFGIPSRAVLKRVLTKETPEEIVCSLMHSKNAEICMDHAVLTVIHHGLRSKSANVRLLNIIYAKCKFTVVNLLSDALELCRLPNREYLEDMLLIMEQADVEPWDPLTVTIAKVLILQKIRKENFHSLLERVASGEHKKPAEQHSLSTLEVPSSDRGTLEIIRTERRVEVVELYIRMSKLKGISLHPDLLNEAVKYQNTKAVIEFLLKEGFKITRDTLNMAFYSLSIEFIELFYRSGARPSQDTYYFLVGNWETASQCAELKGVSDKIAHCLRLLQQWGQPFPTDILLRASHAGHRSIYLVHVCLNQGATIPPENIPELVERLVDGIFKPYHLKQIEEILKKIRGYKCLITNDERYTFLHAAIHGKNPSPILVAFLIENKLGTPSQAVIDFALTKAHENPKEIVLLLLNAQDAALCTSHGSKILSLLNISEADKLEYLKLFYAKTKIRGEDLFIDYFKTYKITKKNVEDRLRLMKEAGIPFPRLKVAILKAYKEGVIGKSDTHFLIELGFLDGQTVKLNEKDRFEVRVPPASKPKVTFTGGSCSLAQAQRDSVSHALNRNQFLTELHNARMARKQDEEKKKSSEEKIVNTNRL